MAWPVICEAAKNHSQNPLAFNFNSTNQELSQEEINSLSECILEMAILPSIIAILELSNDFPAEAQQEAVRFAEACREMNAELPGIQYWTILIQIMENTLINPTNHKILFEIVNNKQFAVLVQVIGRLCAGHIGSIQEAYRENIVIMRHLTEKYEQHSLIYRLLLSYIVAFWKKRIDEQGFAFSVPRLVREEYNTACIAPAEKRLKAILKAVSIGVRVNIPTELLKWLSD